MQCKSLWIKASAKCINVNVNVNTADLPPFIWRLSSIPPPPLLHHITSIIITHWGGTPELGALPQDSTPTRYCQICITFIVLVDVSVKSWNDLKMKYFFYLHLHMTINNINVSIHTCFTQQAFLAVLPSATSQVHRQVLFKHFSYLDHDISWISFIDQES